MKIVHSILVLVLLLCGCSSSKHLTINHSDSLSDREAVLSIKAVIIKQLGEYSGAIMQKEGLICFLSLKDSEYAWVTNQFAKAKVTFKYDIARNATSKGGDTRHAVTGERGVILAVNIINISNNQAFASGGYYSGSHFTEYEYKLIYDSVEWKIVDKKFTWSS